MGNGTEHDSHLNPDHQLSDTLLPCGPVDQTEFNDLTKALSMKGMDVRIAEQRPLSLPEPTLCHVL